MYIREASLTDLDELSVLFAQYRAFYQQNYDPTASGKFLKERIEKGESIIFIAVVNELVVGFTQLYPSFTSVGLARTWILNDLFVAPGYRQQGIARLLIEHAVGHSKATDRKKLTLSTAYDNTAAQKLYERLGFAREDFYNYELSIV